MLVRPRTFNRAATIAALAFVAALAAYLVVTHLSPSQRRLNRLVGYMDRVGNCDSGSSIRGASGDQIAPSTGRTSLHDLTCGAPIDLGPEVFVATFRTPADTRRAMIATAVKAAAASAKSGDPAPAQCQTRTEMFVLDFVATNGSAPDAPAVESAMNRRFCALAGASAPVVPLADPGP